MTFDDGKVVAKLPLLLNGLLGHVCIGTEADGGSTAPWEGERGDLLLRVDQVVPILVADGQGVHHMRGQDRIECGIADDEMVGGEVAGCQVVGTTRLVVVSGVVLRTIADKQAVLASEAMVISARVAPIKVGRWNRACRVQRHQGIARILDDGQLIEGS